MSKITNDALTRSGTGCFLAVSIWQLLASTVKRIFTGTINDAMHKRVICCRKVSLSVSLCQSVCLFVCHDPVLNQNGLTYRRNYFTTW